MNVYARTQALPDSAKDLGEEWQCAWNDPGTGERCSVGGTLKQRKGVPFCRHDCFGHGQDTERTFRQSYYICAQHYSDFLRTHGLTNLLDPSRANI